MSDPLLTDLDSQSALYDYSMCIDACPVENFTWGSNYTNICKVKQYAMTKMFSNKISHTTIKT